MINVSELIIDPDFATKYTVIRSRYEWVNGRYKATKTEILTYYGIVQPASPEDLEQLDLGDRQKGIMKFFCISPNEFYIQNENENQTESIRDTIEYKNNKYKIIQISRWDSNGFLRAFACLLGG